MKHEAFAVKLLRSRLGQQIPRLSTGRLSLAVGHLSPLIVHFSALQHERGVWGAPASSQKEEVVVP